MTDLNNSYLNQAMIRLDRQLLRQVQRFQAVAHHLTEAEPGWPGVYLSANQAIALLQRPFAQPLPTLPQEVEQAFSAALKEDALQLKAFANRTLAEGKPLRFLRLAEQFTLNPFDQQLLLLLIATAVDSKYGRLVGFLHDDLTRKRPSIELALDLFAPPEERLYLLTRFAPDAPFCRHHLVYIEAEPNQALLGPIANSLVIDATVLTWLLRGEYQPSLPHLHRASADKEAAEGFILPQEMQQALALLVDTAVLLQLHGQDNLRQESAANFVAGKREQPLLTLDLAAALKADMAAEAAVSHLLRDAQLTGSLPYIANFDACLTDNAPETAVLERVCSYPDLLITSGQLPWTLRGQVRTKRLQTLACPLPNYAERVTLLNHYLSAVSPEQSTEISGLEDVAGQFQLSSRQIRDVVQTAVDQAVQANEPLNSGHLLAAARTHSNPRLAQLARKVTPRYAWDDLILPEDQKEMLQELVNMVQQRPLVLEQWGVGRKLVPGRGVAALFAGPPGTGKTMAAELIAGELGLDLYKIDLAGLVSKYIGETEKNLERIFTEAETSNAILFFDEADALFGKRSEVKDAHDRYANIEVSYLLQRMEAYDGITILATNFRANLDEAFTRRLQFAISFPFPSSEDRQRIWQTLFPTDVPRAADLDWQRLASRFKLAGGNIRNSIVTATYLAAADGRVVTMQHLLRGIRRELQKLGHLVNEKDLQL